MAVNYTNAVKTARMLATRDEFANGTLEIGTTGFASVLAVFTFSATAGSVTDDVWTAAFVATSVAAGATGTAAEARFKDSVGTVELSGLTVGTSGTDVVVDNTSIASGQTVNISSATITHAA